MPRVTDEAVFDAAIATIQQEGYAGATTKKIALAAGIHEVTLFRRFQSKAELLAQVMAREAESFGGKTGVRSTGDLHKDLVRVLCAYFALLERRGPLIPILLGELPRHPELATVLEYPRSILENVARLIRSYQKKGELIQEDPMLGVAALIAPLIIPRLLGDAVPLALQGDLDIEAHVSAFLQGRATAQVGSCGS